MVSPKNVSASSQRNQEPVLKLTKKEIDILRGSWISNANQKDKKHVDSKSKKEAILSTGAGDQLEYTSTMFGSTFFWIEVYEDLITKYPKLTQFLPTIKHQTIQFSAIMLTAIENLEDLTSIQSFLKRLGRTHIRVFNVEPVYFQRMGDSLFYVLQRRVTDVDVIGLWMRLYCFLANSMAKAGVEVYTLTEEIIKAEDPIYLNTPQLKQMESKPKIASEDEVNNDSNYTHLLPISLDPRGKKHNSKKKKDSLSNTHSQAREDATLAEENALRTTSRLNRIKSKRFSKAITSVEPPTPLSPLSPLSPSDNSINSESIGTTLVARREKVSVAGQVTYKPSTTHQEPIQFDSEPSYINRTSPMFGRKLFGRTFSSATQSN